MHWSSSPRRVAPPPAFTAAVLVFIGAAGACSGGGSGASAPTTTPPPQVSTVTLAGASSLAALPGGGFLAAERATGRIIEVTPAGAVRPDPVVTVAVSNAGAQGLLGLAVDSTGRVFASWTVPPGPSPEAGRLNIAQVFPGPPRTVWTGPSATNQHLGGHLILAPDGRLVAGIGDLGDPKRVADPIATNGKLLTLDPDAPPTQAPVVLSSGWTDPASFGFTPDGRLWVVDRDRPGGASLARGDHGGRPSDRSRLAGSAAGGLAALSTDEIVVCTGSGDGRLERRLVAKTGPASVPASRTVLARGCALGVTRLGDGRIAAAGPTNVRLVTP